MEVSADLAHRQRWVYELVKQYPKATASELASFVGVRDPRAVGRRLSEIEETGWVARAGRRKCFITGRSAETWLAREE